MSYTTTSYGSWSSRVNAYSNSPDSDVLDYINGGDSDWRDLLEESGALAEIQRGYRAAIDAALPPSVALCGNEFIGPAHPDNDEFDGYPTGEEGDLDLAAMIEDIDLGAIVDQEEPLTLLEIGRDVLKSGAKDPAKAAAAAMARLKVKPMTFLPHPESRRPRALFRSGDVTAALAARPGRGTRTDLEGRPA